MSTEPTVRLTLTQANEIADALLAGCFLTTEAEREAAPASLQWAAARNVHNRLCAAMRMLEDRIAQAAIPTPSTS